jgi:hypothetical protein
MTYDAARESEQLRLNDSAINAFLVRYGNKNIPPAQRRTVFLFPGGMGSELRRATTAYDDSNPGQQFQFETVWLTWETLLGNLSFDLEMTKLADGVYRDKDNRIIVAVGPVDLAGVTPYSGFTVWCDLHNIDWFIVGCDWRRRLADSREFFLNSFLPHFRARIPNPTNNPNPLGRIYLVGHSAGGMVVNAILRSGHPSVATFERFITVGTPFYGYGGQLHRWTEGESLLNGPADIFRPKIVRVLTSFPGCYEWHYADEATFNADWAFLTNDGRFSINTYPSLDDSSSQPADPYHPVTQFGGLFRRYPPAFLTGFDEAELSAAGNVVSALAAPVADPTLRPRFFNIRGVGAQDDTLSSVRWKFMTPPYVQLTRPCLLQEPIIDDPVMVPGDGVQPAWTTRLASLPPNQTTPVQLQFFEHMLMMNDPAVLNRLDALMV